MMYESKQWQVRQEKLKKGSYKSKKNQNSATDRGEALAANSRAMCAEAMYKAAITMSTHKSKLWKRSVPDEAVV